MVGYYSAVCITYLDKKKVTLLKFDFLEQAHLLRISHNHFNLSHSGQKNYKAQIIKNKPEDFVICKPSNFRFDIVVIIISWWLFD